MSAASATPSAAPQLPGTPAHRRTGLALTAAIALGVAALAQGAPPPRLNVLMIVADDLRDALGCYGNPTVKTPHLDALAGRGQRFDRAYVQYPVCGPSRTSFMTGWRPEQTRILGNSTFFRDVIPEVVTLPQALRQAGWYTAGYGKVFHSAGDRERWLDTTYSWDDAREAVGIDERPALIAHRNLTGDKLKWCEWGVTTGEGENDPDYLTASAAIEAIDRAGEKPWFIAVGFHRPHDPFFAPKPYFDLYPLASLTPHVDPPGQTTAPKLAFDPEMHELFKRFTDQERREYLRAYYACTSFMDAQVGRVLQALDRRGLRDRTLVVFIGDNGFHLGEREWWNKVTLFEASCRVPLIMAGPGISDGASSRGLTELVDLYPTILDLCGVSPVQALAGTSLRPLLENPAAPGKAAAFSLVTRGKIVGRSVRTARWRYTEWDDGREGIELYDAIADPGEDHDLSRNPAHARTIASLRALFAQLPQYP
jgi:iduronate 2-sulfatase